jgi:hypothetical protein
VFVLGLSVRSIKEVVTQLKEAALSTGLLINENKVCENKQIYNKCRE